MKGCETMKKLSRVLSLLLCVVMVASMLTCMATSQAFSAQVSDTTTTQAKDASDFSWDNATVYFLLTDRFYNADTSNDHSYNRLVNQDGSIVQPSQLNSDITTFHGGDFKGITQKIKEGYFDDLGVNAIWMSAPYEQIHGYVCVNGNDRKQAMNHYAYHGYYALDYTQTDANFGTAEEFRELVNTAHEHDIRVVLDIVMNHPGYNTIYDMKEFDFGLFKTSDDEIWKTYYNWKNLINYHNIIDYNTGSANSTAGWGKWWGPDWLRAGLSGYTPQVNGNDLLGSAGGDLPDFKTENTATVSVPTFLQEKWKDEGRYNTLTSEMNAWFTENNKPKTVRNYLVCWLSEWVREYGVDGFRCDTAKHVELESWKALSDECTDALKEWRANNKGKYEAASWTDDFWMTAEAFGAGVNKDSYYSQGGFDSKINFQFSAPAQCGTTDGPGVPSSGSINSTYADYASKINSDPNFNALTYISSHDTSLCRNDLIYQGSALLLMPGGVQIFYGDESNRPPSNCSFNNAKDHNIRSDMNWSSLDKNTLAHWQKVGTFRNNHIAVGAGSHSSISATSGTAFAREYNKNGISDTVFACIAANKNTNVTLTVGSFVDDGTELKNTYDDTTATVSGGKVTFNSGANGTILVEVKGATTSPDVSVSNTGGNFADTLTITATLNDYATSGTYQVGNAKAVTFTNSATITIGADMDFDESVTIKFTATDGTNTKERNYTYTKIDPDASPFKFPTQRTVYLLDTAKWGKASCYTWTDGAGNANAEWPGVAIEKVGTYEGSDVYEYEVPAANDMIIFNNSNEGKQTANLNFTQNAYYDNSEEKWVPVSVVPTPKPTATQATEKTEPTQDVTTGELTQAVKRGDTDLDSKVTILDATQIQRHLAKLETLSNNSLVAAEVDGDGKVTILDATSIQRYLAKLGNPYNIEEMIYPKQDNTEATEATQAPTQKPTDDPVDDKDYNTVYVDMGYQADAHAHFWTDGGDPGNTWPGEAMTHVSGNVYMINVPKQYNRIIFNNNPSDQTGNLEIPGDGYIYYKNGGNWALYDGNVENPTQGGNIDIGNDNVVYVLNDGNWPSVCIHYWNTSYGTGWPGHPMTKSGTLSGFDLYTYTLPDDIDNFVINIGSNENQSADLTRSDIKGKVYLTASKSFADISNYQ